MPIIEVTSPWSAEAEAAEAEAAAAAAAEAFATRNEGCCWSSVAGRSLAA